MLFEIFSYYQFIGPNNELLELNNTKQNSKNFKGIFKKIVTFKIPNEPNALEAEELKKISTRQGYESIEAKDFKEALKLISTKSKKVICVFGSIYGVGSVLKLN